MIDRDRQVIETSSKVIEAILVDSSQRYRYPIVSSIPVLLAGWSLSDTENEMVLADCRTDDVKALVHMAQSQEPSASLELPAGEIDSPDQIGRRIPDRHKWFDLADIYTDVQYSNDSILHTEDFGVRAKVSAAFGKSNCDFYDRVFSLAGSRVVEDVNVVDLGCATGRAAFHFSARGANVFAVDTSYAMLRRATSIRDHDQDHFVFDRTYEGRKKITRRVDVSDFRGKAVDFILADASDLPIVTGQCSLILSINLVDAVEAPESHLQQMCRVANAQGVCVVTSPYSWATISRAPQEKWLQDESKDCSSRARITEIFEESGFVTTGGGTSIPWTIHWDHRDINVYLVDCLAFSRNGPICL